MNSTYNYPEKFQALADDFFDKYVLEKQIGCPDKKMINVIAPKDRVCRFCGKNASKVSFKKDAHFYPEFLGNRYLLSFFECDDCNLKFGRYEDQFSKFLGIARTMLSVRGKEKIPKFKSPGGKLVFESKISDAGETLIAAERSAVLDQTFEVDKEKKVTKINFVKHSYIPLQVYKALLKMALSCISDEHTTLYKMAFDYIRDSTHDKDWVGAAHVYCYSLPYTYCFLRPVGFLYRKRNFNDPLYTHVFVLHALNSIYEFIIPFNFLDLQFTKGKTGMLLPWAPPIFSGEYPFPIQTIQLRELDLNSSEILKGEKETLAFSMPSESYEISRFIDKNTGKVSEEVFDISKIKGMNFLRTPLDSATQKKRKQP